jgi:hydroxybutyrate-dimer hydrolase
VLSDSLGEGQDAQLPALRCLRSLWSGRGREARQLHEGVESIRASARLPSATPVMVIHGADDGLVPAAFSSRPWVDGVRANGGEASYWEIDRAQHFDVLLGAPGVAGQYVPLLPYGWQALDRMLEVLAGKAELGPDRRIEPTPPPPGEPLREIDLGL